jgi:hypothetical protein
MTKRIGVRRVDRGAQRRLRLDHRGGRVGRVHDHLDIHAAGAHVGGELTEEMPLRSGALREVAFQGFAGPVGKPDVLAVQVHIGADRRVRGMRGG